MLKYHFLTKIRSVQFLFFGFLAYLFPLWKKPDLQSAQESFFTSNLSQKLSGQLGLHEAFLANSDGGDV